MTTDAGKNEDTLTTYLALDLFKKHGLDAKDQVRLKGKGGGKADILIRLGRQGAFIIEAKQGQAESDRQAALADCRRRLDNNHCTAAMAVCYPTGSFTQDSFLAARLDYAIVDQDNQIPAWLSGTAAELAAAVKMAPGQLGNADLAASQLRGELDKGLDKLSLGQKQELARALDLPITPPPKRKKSQSKEAYDRAVAHWETVKYDTAAIRGCLVIASAMMFHARLGAYLSAESKPGLDAREADGAPYSGPWPPLRLGECRDMPDIVAALQQAWDTIMALDYKPVFQTAIAGLKAPDDDANWRDCLKIIAAAAGNLVNDRAGGRQDVMGRIFHRVLDTARYDGSYYTGTAGATLLATLAIRPGDRDWNDLNAIAAMNVTDPACGTGTLPIAAAARIRELARNGDQERLSEILVEKTLHLYDINLTATHMAATTLGLMSPSTQFKNMNVHRTRLGPPEVKRGQPVLPAQVGSLEWLAAQPTLIRWPEYQISEQVETRLEKGPRLAPADLFIMNPPFARDSLRYDQFTEAEEKAIKAREEALLGKTEAHRTGGSNGFVVLGSQNLKANGRIAAVLPASVAQAASGLAIRRMLGKMRVEYVVILKDPQGLAFSENTAISELLLIVQNRKPRRDDRTTFVRVVRKPKTPAQARAMGDAILRGDNHPDYVITYWPQSRIERGDWLPTQFVRDELIDAFQSIKNCQWFPSAAGKDIGYPVQDSRVIRDTFGKSNQSTPQRALWHHKSEVQRTMASKPDVYIKPKADKREQAERHYAQRQRVMVGARLSITNTRVTAVLSDQPTVSGSAFFPYRPVSGKHAIADLEKATVAYLNSTVGITAMLGVTSNKKIIYPNWSIDDWHLLPMPDWGKLSARAIKALVAAYDKLCGREFQELRYMLTCGTRQQLDVAVAQALGIPGEVMEQARTALASEPAITGKAFTGDALAGGLSDSRQPPPEVKPAPESASRSAPSVVLKPGQEIGPDKVDPTPPAERQRRRSRQTRNQGEKPAKVNIRFE